jgi:hypothetical protein
MFLLLMIATMALAWWQWLRMRGPRNRVFQILGIIILLALVMELSGITAVHMLVNITWAYNLFGLVESLLLLAMTGALFPRWRTVLAGSALVVLAAYGINYGMERQLDFLLVEAVLVNALVLSLLFLAVLWELARTSMSPLHRVPEFWLFLGLLVYFSGVIPLMGMLRFLYRDAPEMSEPLYSIILGVGSIRYLLAALACRMAARIPPRVLHG